MQERVGQWGSIVGHKREEEEGCCGMGAYVGVTGRRDII